MELIKFGAEWCNICKQQDVELKKLNPKEVKIKYIDIDDEEDVAGQLLFKKYKVTTLPTLILKHTIIEHRFKPGLVLAEDIKKIIKHIE